MHSPSSYQSLIDNLSREDRQKAQDDLAKRLETGGVDSETWFELRRLLDLMTEREEIPTEPEILTERART